MADSDNLGNSDQNPPGDDPLGLQTILPDGTVPESRIRDAGALNNLAENMWWADRPASYDRAVIDDQIEGAPPLDPGDLRANGLGNSANVNFLGSFGKEEISLSAYNNLVFASEKLIFCDIPEASPETRLEKSQAFAEEYTWLLKYRWPNFVRNVQYLAKYYIRHGVAIAFRSDPWDWRWSVSRLGDFQVQRRQNCSEDDFELAIQRSFYSPTEIYDLVRDRESAKKVGWDIDATVKAIQAACVPLYSSNFDVEQWQRDAKDNSLWWTQGKAKQVELRHAWVKEFDESVTCLITSPDNDKDFLFEKKARFKSCADAMTIFCYGVGNMDLYSVRGLGWKLFGSEQLLNVLKCKAANLTMKSMGIVWQANSENGMEDFQSITYGDDTVAPSGFTMTQMNWPNLTASAIPMIAMLSSGQQINTGTYTPSPGQDSNVEMTAKEYEGRAQQQMVLTTSAVDLFYQAWDRADQMTVRALVAEDYPRTMPGGKERWEFITRLLKRGLTMKEIQSVDCVRHVRAIGAGSEAMKRAKLGQLQGLSQFMDPQGQRAIQRAIVVDLAGVDHADAFLPAQGERIPDDKKVAELEANSFMFGVVPEVMPKEDDIVHLGEHFQFLDAQFAKLGQGQLEPPKAIEYIGTALEHTKAHIGKMSTGVPEESNVPRRQLIKQVSTKQQQYEAQLQKLIAITQKQMQAEQEAVAKQQQEMTSDALEQKRKDMIAQADIARQDAIAKATIERGNTITEQSILDKRARTNADLEHKAAQTNADIHHDAITTEADILSKTRKTQQELAVNDILTAQELEQKRIDNSQPQE
jgi:hypothetical protein